jgi:ceramide glucosyltransferase
MPLLHALSGFLGFAALGVAAGYSALTLFALMVWRLRARAAQWRDRPPVTLLKPLCGAEPGLYEHLRGFCRQDYPEYQVIFGVRESSDPAVAVASRLATEFPSLPIHVVVDSQQHGNNYKISNLINMLKFARHDLLVMADSDAYVGPDYLSSVTAPLLDPQVGLVTCTYQGVPTPSVWSRLGAMYINEWYIPSVLVAWLFGHDGYVSGQTTCIRRATLDAIGGLQSIVDHLADDHRLGELVETLGLRIVLSPYVVKGEHHEPSYGTLTRHELRWMRTLRVLKPLSFRMIFLTFSLPLAALGLLFCSWGAALSTTAWVLCTSTVLARLLLHFAGRTDRPWFSDVWLLPLRDLLLCWIWYRSFSVSRITWRGIEFDVHPNGCLRRLT